MYFNYNNEPFCCNLDWLSYSVLTNETNPEILCPEGYRLEVCQGNNIFENRAILYAQNGAKYLTLLWMPYSSVLPKNLMTIQVANEYLYLGGIGVKWSFDDLSKIVDCTFNAVGRFDICLDWQGNEKRIQFLNNLNNNHLYVQRKSEGSVWWHTKDNGTAVKKQLHCLSWGSQSSEIKVKIYHKSREQGMLSPTNEPEKPWIVNEWRQAQMDVTNIWRLEFSFSGAGQLRYRGQLITLDMIADERWLLGVLCECFESRFVTRKNEGKRYGHKNLDERVYLLQLPKSAEKLKWADARSVDHECPASITLLRSMMRQIDNPAVMCHRPTFESYASAIMQIVNDHRLSGYFLRTYEKNADDYFNELWQSAGTGKHQVTLSPAHLMD